MPLQQASDAHDWPKRAQPNPPSGAYPPPPPPSGEAPLPPLPPSSEPPFGGVVPPSPPGELPGGGRTGVHVPWIDPGNATHGRPEQQSALAVQLWPLDWHDVAPHCSAPLGPGTHGLPLQQSLAVEHAAPAATQPRPASPGTPV